MTPRRSRRSNVGFNLVPAMLSGKVDATLGGFWNYEGVQLARSGKHPSIIRVDQAGVPTYDELVLVARQADARRTRANLIRRFLRALARRATQSPAHDPAAAASTRCSTPTPTSTAASSWRQVKATLPVFFPRRRGKPFGFAGPGRVAALRPLDGRQPTCSSGRPTPAAR